MQYLWKRAVRITKKPNTPQRERLYMLRGNPVIFTDHDYPVVIIGFSLQAMQEGHIPTKYIGSPTSKLHF